MAKRTLAPSQLGTSNTTAPVTDVSIRFSLEDEEDPQRRSDGSEQQVRLSSEEAPQKDTDADAAVPCDVPEWNFVCPFCCAAQLTDPVELHAPVVNTVSGGRQQQQQQQEESCHCLACRACAERWRTAMCVLGVDSCSVGSGTTFATEVSAPLTCPLCSSITPLCATREFSTPAVDASHIAAVRNSYTGQLHTSGGAAPAASAAVYCGVCETQKATCVCVQCDFGLCSVCHEKTHTIGKFKQHTIVGLDQARCRDQQKCSEHPGNSLDLYCETCATCVCVTCCFGGAHRGHEVFPLPDVAQRTAAVLAEEAAELSQVVERATACRDALALLGPEYDVKVAAVAADVSRCFASLRRVLQEREDSLLAELHHTADDVRGRAGRLLTATDALADLLRGASAQLAAFPQVVSAATLVRVASQLQERQAWTLRTASRLTAEAAATGEGWAYQLGEEGRNGCRMACFNMLDAQTVNERGMQKYRQVLGDLGRLEVSADLQPPTVRSSAMESDADHDDREEEEEMGPHRHSAANMDKSVLGPIVEVQPESPTPSHRLHPERSTSASSSTSFVTSVLRSAAAEENDASRLRPSHTSAVLSLASTSSSSAAHTHTSDPARSTRATEMHLVRGGSSSRAVSRGVAPRSATASSTNATRASLPHSLVIGGTQNSGSSSSGNGSANHADNTAAVALAAGASSSRTTSQMRVALEALERREAESCQVAASSSAHLARDTMPFHVSTPQRRVLSFERTEEVQQWWEGGGGNATTGASAWRALKLQRTSMAQDTALADVAARISSLSPAPTPTSVAGSGGGGFAAAPSSTWRLGGSSRLSLYADLNVSKPSKSNGVSPVRALHGDTGSEEQRSTVVRRRTTGLHLEL